MLPPVVVLMLLLAYNVRSEVSQDSPAEQTIKNANITNVDQLTKLYKDYENLTLDVWSVPAVRYGEVTLKDECEKNGGNGTFERTVKAMKDMKKCFGDLISYAELPAKIKKSKPYGELDVVFKEYCQKTSEMEGCITYFLAILVNCMDDRHKSGKYTLQEITEVIMKFVCENEGDHIALFISEKGPDCILSKQAGIKKCFEEILPQLNKTDVAKEEKEANSHFDFSKEFEVSFDLGLELRHCRVGYQLRKCIVEELTSCSGSTPANVIDSIFNLVQNTTICSKFKMEEIDPNYSGGTSLFTSLFSVILPALTVLLVRTFSS